MARGAMHRVRWMAKAQYAVKVFMFCSQFKFTMREEKAMQRISGMSRYPPQHQEMTWLSSRDSPLVSNKEALIFLATFDSYVWYLRNVYRVNIMGAYGRELQPLVATPKTSINSEEGGRESCTVANKTNASLTLQLYLWISPNKSQHFTA